MSKASRDKKKKNTQTSDTANSLKSKQDPTGSYTGVPTDGSTFPTQDADDL